MPCASPPVQGFGTAGPAVSRAVPTWRGPVLFRPAPPLGDARRSFTISRSESLTASVILCLRRHLDAGNPRHEASGQLDAHATSTGLNHGLAKLSAVVPRRGSRRGGVVGGGTTRSFVHVVPLPIRPAPGCGRAVALTTGRKPGPSYCVRRSRRAALRRQARPASGIPAGHCDRSNDTPAPGLESGAGPSGGETRKVV